MGERDGQSALHDSESFARLTQRQLGSGGMAETAGEDRQMTLIAMTGYEDLRERLDPRREGELLSTIGACLKEYSMDGDAAGRLDSDRFGLIHGADLDLDALQERITGITREADPTKKGISVKSATVTIDRENASPQDIANGLVYAINRFRGFKGTDFSVDSLTKSISDLAGEAVRTVSAFKSVVAEGDFTAAFQPIIDARTGVIHHYEALARFRPGEIGKTAYEHITFAEETGLVAEFDIAMARKVIDWLNKTPRNSKTAVAVNVSGISVGTLSYLSRLDQLLAANVWARGRLMFEITESAQMTDLDAANAFIQRLRTQGYGVCLDDFGAGAANFQYLSALEIDVVKLDGSAVRNAVRAHKGKAFLKALVALCRELGVSTIAEMIDDERTLAFVRACGVEYVQGFLFGQPSADVSVFRNSIPREMFTQGRAA